MSRILQFYKLALLVLLTGIVSFGTMSAQKCTISLAPGQKDNGCVPFAVNYQVKVSGLPSGAIAQKFDWQFGDGQSNVNKANDSLPTHTFTSASVDTTKDFTPSITITTNAGSSFTCKATFNVKVWGKPVPRIKFPALTTQCFKNNLFCFKDNSSMSKSKIPIKSYAWDLGDGNLDTGTSPTCHHYATAGKYTITLTVTDQKGCYDADKQLSSIIVLEQLKLKYAIVANPVGCIPDTVRFRNQTDTNGYHVKSFYWNFGDGSAKNTTDLGIDKKKLVEHVYRKKGKFSPVFFLETKEGCKDSVKVVQGVTIFDPHITLHIPDTVCWTTAKKGLTFTADTVDGSDDQIWTFKSGDPLSDTKAPPADAAKNGYSALHPFYSGPKIYQFHFTAIHKICGNKDTCFSVPVFGPIARINIPKPPAPIALEDFKPSIPATPKEVYGRQFFYDALSQAVCPTVNSQLHPAQNPYAYALNYSYYTKNAKDTTVIDSNYCNAKVKSTYKVDTLCNGQTTSILTSYFAKASGFVKRVYRDSTERQITWNFDLQTKKFDNIPGQNASFRLDSFLSYYDARKKLGAHLSDSLSKLGFTAKQIRTKIETAFSKNGKTKVSKYNTISNESFNTDSFYGAINDGRNPSKYNSIVGSQFNTDSYLVWTKNPKTHILNAYNTLGILPMIRTQSTGTFFDQNMHDSDKYDCYYPNLVRFTNNSIKFRGKYTAVDDQWPTSNALKDTCLSKSWPWSSDSLQYLWDFADNGQKAEQCTSTYSGINWGTKTPKPGVSKWDCAFSSIAAPYHFYRDTVAPNPWKPCYFPKMAVYDPITKCGDTETFIILMGPPYPGYDTTVFCKMNYYIQNLFGTAPASSKPYKGFRLLAPQACAGPQYLYTVSFKETIPGTCDAPQDYLVAFDYPKAEDSAKATRDIVCLHNRKFKTVKGKNVLGFDTIWNHFWIPKSKITNPFVTTLDPITGGLTGGPVRAGKFSFPDTATGWKSLEVIMRNGDCWDTFKFPKYIYFQKLSNNLAFGNAVDKKGVKTPLKLATYVDFTYLNTPIRDTTIEKEFFNLSKSPIFPYQNSNTGNFTRRICPDSKGAATFYLQAKDTTMINVTKFVVTTTREMLPSGDFYFTRPFWPRDLDTSRYGTLDVDGNYLFTDSLNAKLTTYYIPALTSTDSVYIKVYNPANKTTTNFKFNGDPRFYITQEEKDSLDAGYNPHLSKKTIDGRKDPRFALFDVTCDGKKFGDTAYHPLKLYKQPVGKVKYVKKTVILNLKDTSVTDYKNPKKSHGIAKVVLPAPGVYKIQTYVENNDGCGKSALSNNYEVINGHFAKFATDKDPVGCKNDVYQFFDTIRYFQTSNSVTPLIPPFFVSNYDSWTWDSLDDGTGTIKYFRPWDVDPVIARSQWDPQWKPSNVAIKEKVEWDFDNDGKIDAVGHNPKWRYKAPGVYTVNMISTDSNGCKISTLWRNYIKIINMVDSTYVIDSKGNINDTVQYCAPQTFKIIDWTYMNRGKNTVNKGRDRFGYIDSVLVVDNTGKKYIKADTVIVDSISKVTWNQGDGRDSFTILKQDTAVKFTYTFNDTFTVAHKSYTSRTCSVSKVKKRWLIVAGPSPRFKITSGVIGCLPFTVVVQNLKLKDSSTYNFDKHDGTSVTSDSSKEYVGLTFDHLKPIDSLSNSDSSIYSIDVLMTTNRYNPVAKTTLKCSAKWPDTIARPTDTTFYVTVYRRDSVKIIGDTLVCPKESAKFSASTKRPSLYTGYKWDFGDNQGASSSADGADVTHKYAKAGIYTVTLTARSKYIKFGCPNFISTFKIRVDSVKAWIVVDSAKSDFFLGKIVFRTKGIKDGDTVAQNSMFGVKYDIETIDFDSSTGTGSKFLFDATTIKDHKPYEGYNYDYGARLPQETSWDPKSQEKKSWSFKIKMTSYSDRPCIDDTTIAVRVNRDFVTYNIFTPGDANGKNDVFNPTIKGETNYQLMIFNRWGNKVFESTDAKSDWDGKNFNDGSDCAAGTYFYIIKYDLIGRKKGIATRYGTVTLVR